MMTIIFLITVASPCKYIHDKNMTEENKAYLMDTASQNILVYCHMNHTGLGACGGGGWTLVMKIDGTQGNFHYGSNLWNNKDTFNPAGGKTGFDTQETKLPTYWNTPFSKICLGMRIGQQINFVTVEETASSLYSLISDGQYRGTSLGRNTWKGLIGSQASLQTNCNKEGFNAACGGIKVRMGIISNNEEDCVSCDSRIGFGTDDSNTCGNKACCGADNGNINIKAMGYILVQ